MDIAIGFAKSEAEVLVQQIDLINKTNTYKIIDANSAKEEALNTLISPSADWIKTMELDQEQDLYPILESNQAGFDFEKFEQADADSLSRFYQKQVGAWVLKKNLDLIEGMFTTTNRLRSLWTGDRLAFFEDLWTLLKKNLGTTELSLLFNDIEEIQGKDETKKQKLVQSVLTGKKTPEFKKANEHEIALMGEFKNTETFTIHTLNLDKNEFVATVMIDKSPILMMAKIPSFNEIQKALLNGIFKGLEL